jgi:hypothetical protein
VKGRILVSFSGGRSSAVMSKLLHDRYSDSHDLLFVFANTGCEHEESLRFVDRCDKTWKLGVHWIEAVTNERGIGQSAKRVDYCAASRNGEPFESAIKKYGIFNAAYPNCTGRLKSEPIHWYAKNIIGWRDYDTAIGIRADECDRMDRNAKKKRLIYPLITAGLGKTHVNEIMRNSEIDLKLPGDHYGNCVWCWKKSLRKLLTVAKQCPTAFDFPARMESESKDDRVFFRNNLSSRDVVAMSQSDLFDPYADSKNAAFDFMSELPDLDIGGGCGDSCEIHSDYSGEAVK